MILKSSIQPVLITTGNSKVRQCIQTHYNNVNVIECDRLDKHSLLEIITSLNYNMLITYRCPYILPLACIENLTFGGYNIHPSLLPQYAGLNPWDAIFKNKEKKGGVTIHRLTEKADEGEILMQRDYQITNIDTIKSARTKADELAAEMVEQFLFCNFPE